MGYGMNTSKFHLRCVLNYSYQCNIIKNLENKAENGKVSVNGRVVLIFYA